MDFVAIDVETANQDLASICQIGLAAVQAGAVVGQWSALVNPEDAFSAFNTEIHGIDESMVLGAPTFAELHAELQLRTASNVIVSHTSFDRTAISRAAERYGLSLDVPVWLDSAAVARRAWPERYAAKGYGLANVASDLGIAFRHHDAGEDARAAAEIVIQASRAAGLDIDGWISRVRQQISAAADVRCDGEPDGPLHGEVVVFTGSLGMPRRAAAALAASAGCNVESGVSKRTTLLVVGDQDMRRLAGNSKSSKQRKAEALITKGVPIRFLSESDFKTVVSQP